MPQPVTGQYVCCKYQGKDLGLGYRGEKTCFFMMKMILLGVYLLDMKKYCSRCLYDYTNAGVLRLDGII